ncbi:tumor necrosis factor receptor superfamily member 6-like isoform X2 [Stegastes partitus]|uniref:Tumor necrosis factor receptor superfamily member 6-like isoform X2 n=1 Tax=Stegastes partitus TaxID=144197 RepID=A0A9Y4JKR9_9TELE|nr:PREDICTED: tumor necrosis factor receptor superfamily member 6-like isoform X2 [Stegastes partitus]
MNNFLLYTVFSVLIWLPKSTRSYPQSGLDLRDSRTQQDLSCRDNLEYPHGNICCLNCPAGTHVESPCTKAGEKGKCEECDFGTFIEHANGLKQCFKCTLCRSDQEIVRSCTHTQDTECRCKSGRFCDPDQACEVCKKCSRCKKDEETVRNCTSTSNTECKKIQAKSDSSSGKAWVIAIIVVGAVLLVGVIIFATYKWRRRKQESQRPGGMKAGLHYTDTDPTEGCRDGETRRPSNTNLSLSRQLEDRQFPELVPVNGEESLRSCFELFEEVAVDQCKKFFRHLGISDNVIKSRETLSHEEMIHELLNIWIEKVGREANLNELLKVLLDINQRRTAEIIKERAVQNGEYFCKS